MSETQNEFLVNIRFSGDEHLSKEQSAALLRDERARARELSDQGVLVRMWRVPGRRENWGLWRVADATELHETLTSLPYWPYMSLDVHPMAKHPVDPIHGNNRG